jgi:hypothetical protein
MKNRRRLLWLCTACLLIVGGIAWLLFANRDADFHVIGPKTPGVRANLTMLDSKIDVAEFRDCKTLRETLNRLNDKQRTVERKLGSREFWVGHDVVLDRQAFAQTPGVLNIAESPVQFTSNSKLVTVKQFLRGTFRQTGANDVHFILHRGCIEATTPERVQEERARYLDSVSLFDRVHNAWKEMTGQVEDDVIEIEIAENDPK